MTEFVRKNPSLLKLAPDIIKVVLAAFIGCKIRIRLEKTFVM